jgi:hypothetical protein
MFFNVIRNWLLQFPENKILGTPLLGLVCMRRADIKHTDIIIF